jgi:hypothetical protein
LQVHRPNRFFPHKKFLRRSESNKLTPQCQCSLASRSASLACSTRPSSFNSALRLRQSRRGACLRVR